MCTTAKSAASSQFALLWSPPPRRRFARLRTRPICSHGRDGVKRNGRASQAPYQAQRSPCAGATSTAVPHQPHPRCRRWVNPRLQGRTHRSRCGTGTGDGGHVRATGGGGEWKGGGVQVPRRLWAGLLPRHKAVMGAARRPPPQASARRSTNHPSPTPRYCCRRDQRRVREALWVPSRASGEARRVPPPFPSALSRPWRWGTWRRERVAAAGER